jgi:hypothetical protein
VSSRRGRDEAVEEPRAAPSPGPPLAVARIAQLQRSAGNRAVAEMLTRVGPGGRGLIQPAKWITKSESDSYQLTDSCLGVRPDMKPGGTGYYHFIDGGTPTTTMAVYAAKALDLHTLHIHLYLDETTKDNGFAVTVGRRAGSSSGEQKPHFRYAVSGTTITFLAAHWAKMAPDPRILQLQGFIVDALAAGSSAPNGKTLGVSSPYAGGTLQNIRKTIGMPEEEKKKRSAEESEKDEKPSRAKQESKESKEEEADVPALSGSVAAILMSNLKGPKGVTGWAGRSPREKLLEWKKQATGFADALQEAARKAGVTFTVTVEMLEKVYAKT